MNVSSSITPLIGERLIGIRSKLLWTDVDWNKVEEHVNRLQARITKAVKEQKWHLVKRLQYLITHSFYAKLLYQYALIKQHSPRKFGVIETRNMK